MSSRSTPCFEPQSLPMLVAGGVSIVAGGVVAAVTGPTGWSHGSWMAAFLVLAAGVAQVGIGFGQFALSATKPSRRFALAEWASWNVGCLAVIVGTLVSSPLVVTIGGAVLGVALAMSAFAVRAPARRRALALAYRTLIVVVLVSIPIGITLSWARR